MAESQSTSNAPGDPTKITRLRELLSRHQEKGWDEAWKDEATPWDAGTMQPALQELVESSELDLPKSGRALVPGCGRGYDAVFIAKSLGLETIGIDISPTAIEAANEYKRAVDPTANVRFEETSFFALNDASFEPVYDYTYAFSPLLSKIDRIYERQIFVALPPSMRPEWGIQMGKIVKHGGFLITLVYPMLPYTDAGPPFYVRPEHYEEALGPGWIKVWDRVPEKTLETHVGKERMIVWQRL